MSEPTAPAEASSGPTRDDALARCLPAIEPDEPVTASVLEPAPGVRLPAAGRHLG